MVEIISTVSTVFLGSIFTLPPVCMAGVNAEGAAAAGGEDSTAWSLLSLWWTLGDTTSPPGLSSLSGGY